MAILSQAQIKANIQSELADNNAGLISAYDVRHNMEDLVDSINQIVASGDFDVSTPFTGSNVRFQKLIIAGSGISFPNAETPGIQYEPYPGPGSIQHNQLGGLAIGDPHVQYLPLNGVRVMSANLGLGNNWINSSGASDIVSSNNRGLQFQTQTTNTGIVEQVKVGSNTRFIFNTDNSVMSTAKGVAKAWISFDASGVDGLPKVLSSYNVKELQKLDVGKFKVIFNSGTLSNNSYVAIGNSNSRGTSNSPEDFDLNTVGIVARNGDDASVLRNMTFCVLNDGNQFVDAALNDIVVYGLAPNESSGVPPVVTVL
jgi:hypothetical protein